MLEYHVNARRIDARGSEASVRDATGTLDTDMAGRADAFSSAERLMAGLAASMPKGTERVIPILGFSLRGMTISLRGTRQDSPLRMQRIVDDIVVDTDESDARLALLHCDLLESGRISNSLGAAVELSGTIRRA